MPDTDAEVIEDYQRSTWNIADSHLNTIFQALDRSNLHDSFKGLFDINVFFTKDLIIYYLLKYQKLKADSSSYGFIAAELNSIFPEFGSSLVKEGTAQFVESYNRGDEKATFAVLSLLSTLFNYEVIHEIVILQILHLLLENFDDFSTNLVVNLLRDSGKHLMEVSATAHDMIFEKLRNLLQDGKLTYSTSKAVELLFDLRRTNYSTSKSDQPLPNSGSDTHIHTFVIDQSNIAPSKDLKQFKFDSNFIETEKSFDALKERVLRVVPDEEKKVLKATDMTGNSDIEFKKRLYLIIKSSLSGDEAAHKILKLRVADQEKYRVVDVIVKSSIQEPTYSKFYGLLSERLCSSHKSWKPAFEKIFEQNYDNSDELEPFQLRTLGRFWGHILASDYIGFEVFQCVHMNEEETSPPGRIFLKFAMQELIADLGIEELKKRFEDDYIQPYLKNMFPEGDPEKVKYSINYFTAIGLGTLTDRMRENLRIIGEASREKSDSDTEHEEGRRSDRHRPLNSGNFRRQGDGFGTRRRNRSQTPPRRQRTTSLTPPRRKNRSRSPLRNHAH